MNLLEIIAIAFGLSMDAFAVSITLGLSVEKPSVKELMIPGLYFGFFQALMPALGYFAGFYFVDAIQGFDHWVAFVLLGFVGGKMIKDSLSKEEEQKNEHSFHFIKMLILAVATSIDALAVGIPFALFKVNIILAVAITGPVTFFVSMLGVKTGNVFGAKYKSKAEFAGGAVLVLLGVKIVVEKLFFGRG